MSQKLRLFLMFAHYALPLGLLMVDLCVQAFFKQPQISFLLCWYFHTLSKKPSTGIIAVSLFCLCVQPFLLHNQFGNDLLILLPITLASDLINHYLGIPFLHPFVLLMLYTALHGVASMLIPAWVIPYTLASTFLNSVILLLMQCASLF